MAPQKRASRSSTKKASKLSASRKGATPRKSTTSSRRKRSVVAAGRPTTRKAGVLKQAIKKGISELSKVGT